MNYRIRKIEFHHEIDKAIWYIEKNGERDTGAFGSEEEAALCIYNLMLAEES